MKQYYLLLVFAFSATFSFAQSANGPWENIDEASVDVEADATLQTFAANYRLLELDPAAFHPNLSQGTKSFRKVTVPMPGGEWLELNIKLDQVIAPGLADKYPSLKTYRILPQGKTIYGGRLGWTYQGFHATIRTNNGTVYIDPYSIDDQRYYVSYYVHENIDDELWSSYICGVDGEEGIDPDDHHPDHELLDMLDKGLLGETLVQRKYRLAVACTPEFADYHGNTKESTLSAMVIIVNRLNDVFEVDLAVRVELIADNDKVIFLNDGTPDPYPNNVPGDIFTLNPDVLNDSLGPTSYDIGHVFGRNNNGGEGIASLRGVCQFPIKGQASSSRNAPQGDAFTVDIVAHEMGHQMGARHTMSSCQNVNPPTSYEPGSGSTIMSYAGICPAGNNLQANADPYYHVMSLQQIFAYTRTMEGNDCPEKIDLGNTIPEVSHNYEDGFYVPISTPFELIAEGTDMENDDLTYCWEGFDKNEAVETPPGSPIGNSPIFRTWPPQEAPNRIFPRMQNVVTNTSTNSEVLPTYSRALTFRCTVRDNFEASGGAAWTQVAFQSTDEAGPFLVSHPNSGAVAWQVGSYEEVTWDVANTDGALVNCQRVNIELSTDGGYNYTIMLLENTPNDGSAFVTVPDAVGGSVRVRVKAADNVFFDISNNNFSIEPAQTAGYTLDHNPQYQQVCTPESAVVELVTGSILSFDNEVELDLISTLPDGITHSFSADAVQPGSNSTLTLDLGNTEFAGLFSVDVRAVSMDTDTTYRTFDVEVINNDHSALATLTPAAGETDINLSTVFSWDASPNALTYDWELSTSPAFGDDVVDSSYGVAETMLSPSILLEENNLFYWRVRANNSCGSGEWLTPRVFHTINAVCQENEDEDTPITIPGTGPLPTRISQINVPFEGIISDINIPLINVQYQPIQNFTVTLRSPGPDPVEVVLYDGNCFGTDQVAIGFDDDAPNEITCPPIDFIVFQPVGMLSDFVGVSTQGVWELEVKINESGFGAPGAINQWKIEFCATANPSTPTLITNETLLVPPGEANPITQNLLEVEDGVTDPFDLEYTLVTIPANGQLYHQGTVLEIGSVFRQSSINAVNIYYEHDGSATTTDKFDFVVQNDEGGFLPVDQFNIVIDPDAPVSTDDPEFANDIRLFPNPASDWLKIELDQPLGNDELIRIVNVKGQLLHQMTLAQGSTSAILDIAQLPAGVYIVEIGQYTERLIKQ